MPFIPVIALNTPTTISFVFLPKADPTAQIKKQYETLTKGWKMLDAKVITSVWATDYTEIQSFDRKAKTANRKEASALVQSILKKWDKAEIAFTIQSLKLTDGGKKAQVVVSMNGTITVNAKTKRPQTAGMTARFNHLWVNNGKTWLLKHQSPDLPKQK